MSENNYWKTANSRNGGSLANNPEESGVSQWLKVGHRRWFFWVYFWLCESPMAWTWMIGFIPHLFASIWVHQKLLSVWILWDLINYHLKTERSLDERHEDKSKVHPYYHHFPMLLFLLLVTWEYTWVCFGAFCKVEKITREIIFSKPSAHSL